MRIVIDATAAISGGKVYLDHLLPHLFQLGRQHEFIVFHTDDFAPEEQSAWPNHCEFRRLALPAGHWAGASVARLLWRLLALPWHLRRLQPDWLFSNAGTAPWWRPRATRLVLALHNSMPLRKELIRTETSPLRRLRLLLLRQMLRRALRRCDRALVFSEDSKQRVLADFAVAPATLAVIHHGIDWGAKERACTGDGLNLREPYLLYVSQFHRYKNVLPLLTAFASLNAQHPELCLVLAGEAADKAYWREIEACIAQLGLSERVKHLAAIPRAQLPELYRGALAFVHPSLAETCSFPLLEALALGVPIAAARLSALPEIAGEAAVYFDPYDAAELAAVLERLLDDAALRAELSRKAVLRAAQFSWRACAEQTLRVLEEAAQES